ncbi:possible high light inducible protein [Parasynechococcus marenigrum WH 8102]|jgi:hypothetical protein|uniref:Possible high light inducible protein n=2 Tax=Parasynechococcus TaxID=2881427 RepID=Q7U6K7_PARMW|nr:possible high light inducible protein [Parasynechococcus marenigrum WH 8102]
MFAAMTRPAFQYEQPERFGESLTTARPWNKSALTFVERLNGRAAMVGFSAAVLGELFTGQGIVGQLTGVVRWYLELG